LVAFVILPKGQACIVDSREVAVMTTQAGLRIRKTDAMAPFGGPMTIQTALEMATRATFLEEVGFELAQGFLDDPFFVQAGSHRALENPRVFGMALKACFGIIGCLGMPLTQGMTSATGKLGMGWVWLFPLMATKAGFFFSLPLWLLEEEARSRRTRETIQIDLFPYTPGSG